MSFLKKLFRRRPHVSEKEQTGKKNIIATFPYDRFNCECVNEISRLKQDSKLKSKFYDCPRSLLMDKYKIVCSNCGDTVAFIHATDSKLTDWCNLHYTCESDGVNWHGALAVNLSPIDSCLGFECACGQDTRDFRANNTLPPHVVRDINTRNLIGREFGKKDSKFKAIKL